MPKRNEHLAEGTFPLAALERLLKRALKRLEDCEEFHTPQRQQVELSRLAELPRLDDLPGIAPSQFWAEGHLPARGNESSVLTDVLRRGRKKLRGARLEVRCEDAGLKQNCNWVAAEFSRGAAIEAWLPGLLRDLDPQGREPILKRVIQAGRLPARVIRKSVLNWEQIDLEHTAEGNAYGNYSDRHGALSVRCDTPGDTADEQMKRVSALMKELALEPEGYVWRVLKSGDAEECLKAYDTLRALPLPVSLCRLDLAFTLTELTGVESLRRLAAMAGRKQFLTTLCRFPLPAGSATARKKLGKVLVRTSGDGHRVSLFLPPDDAALLASLGDKLGLHFPA
jgi:hypothetical protein